MSRPSRTVINEKNSGGDERGRHRARSAGNVRERVRESAESAESAESEESTESAGEKATIREETKNMEVEIANNNSVDPTQYRLLKDPLMGS